MKQLLPTSVCLVAMMFSTMLSVWGATLTVTSADDVGSGTFRQAILDANADVSSEGVTIAFNIPGPGVHTISPLTPFDTITRSVTIDGYTQPGTCVNTLPTADNAVLLIEFSGDNLSGGPTDSALRINANNCVVRGLVFNRFLAPATVLMQTSDNSVVEGNFFGTDTAGTIARGNYQALVIYGSGCRVGGLAPAARNIISGNSAGIYLQGLTNAVLGNFIGVGSDGQSVLPNSSGAVTLNYATQNRIGGSSPGAGNVISGNDIGIFDNVGCSNIYQGNFVGTDASGTLSRGNRNGIVLNEASASLVGGRGAGEGNLISGNSGIGMSIEGYFASNNVVLGNLIGTDVAGAAVLGNGEYGVYINCRQNRIGGTRAGEGNVIFGSHSAGVAVYGLSATNNAVLGNSIFGNEQAAIDLAGVWFSLGPTPNDPEDADDDANHLQNFPEIISTMVGSTHMSVDYRVDSTSGNSAYPLLVEFFIADGTGQGRTFVHRESYSTPQAVVHSTFVPAITPVPGDKLVGTATDANGNTSEFTILPVSIVPDTTPPTIHCPANIAVGCSMLQFVTVGFPAPTATDDLDPHPTVICTPASGSASFSVGVTTVQCTAVDAAGNRANCSFTVNRATLGFSGFLPPIGGEVLAGTGGGFADPVRSFKFGSTIPVKFRIACGGTSIATGIHTLQITKYSNSVDSDPPIDATPTDGATDGNQFHLTDGASGEWHFNLDTKPLSVGTWKLGASLSDGSIHEVWVSLKK